MNKRKYIEKLSGHRSNWIVKKHKRLKHKKTNPENLPFRESMCKLSERNKSYHNFKNYNHLRNFFESRIGYDWNDIYSELISKIKKKYRYEYELNEQWYYYPLVYSNVFYNENGLPINSRGNIILTNFYINQENKLAYYPSIDEYYRQTKIKKFHRLLGIKYDDLAEVREMIKIEKKNKNKKKVS